MGASSKGNSKIKWTFATVESKAAQYRDLKSFRLDAMSCYETARVNGWLPDACPHLYEDKIFWNKSLCQTEAAKYSSLTSFKKNANSAYNYVVKNNLINEVCSHMSERINKPFGYWDVKENVLAEGRKYETRSEWRNLNNKSYRVATKTSWIDELTHFKHKPQRPKQTWTTAKIAKAASQYTSYRDFAQKDPCAYQAAKSYNILDEVTSHFLPSDRWDRKEGIVYLYQPVARFPSLYKFGIASDHRFSERIHSVQSQFDSEIGAIYAAQVNNARETENVIRTYGLPVKEAEINKIIKHKNRKYNNAKYIDGITELRFLTPPTLIKVLSAMLSAATDNDIAIYTKTGSDLEQINFRKV